MGEELGKAGGTAEDGLGQAAAGDDVGGEREGDSAEIGDAEPDIALRDECAQAPQGPLMATETAGQDVAADDDEYRWCFDRQHDNQFSNPLASGSKLAVC